jgi:hypothetical protein
VALKIRHNQGSWTCCAGRRYQFYTHITLCVTHDNNVQKLGIDPAELLRMIQRQDRADQAGDSGVGAGDHPTTLVRD